MVARGERRVATLENEHGVDRNTAESMIRSYANSRGGVVARFQDSLDRSADNYPPETARRITAVILKWSRR